MLPDSPFSEPLSSFQQPVAPLTVEPDASPLETLQINSAWLALLRGCAKQLLLETTWLTSDPDVLNLAQERAFNLIGLLQDQGVVMSLPAGTVVDFAGSTIPTGWLDCDGSAVSRSTYADLFAAVGTTYGAGNGTTTFNLPDARGRTLIGVGQGSGLTNRTLAATVGEESHTLNATEMPQHNHSLSMGLARDNVVATIGYGSVSFPGTNSTGYAGSTGAHNNMQPSLAVHIIIKT